MANAATAASDEYVRKVCAFIRNNDAKLSESAVRRRRSAVAAASYLSWLWSAPQRIVFSIAADKLYSLLVRLDETDIPVGPLDFRPDAPFTHPVFQPQSDRSDSMSIASIRSSISAISKLSIPGTGFFYQPPTLHNELKFLYSSFTRLPALSVHSHPTHAADACTSLDAFKSMENLELMDMDPRRIFAWDKLSYTLRILTLCRCALEDINHLLVDAVLRDSKERQLMDAHPTDTIIEDEGLGEGQQEDTTTNPSASLPAFAWSQLLSLSITNTGLTFIPDLPSLPRLTHIDLSSNLLVTIPQPLSSLTRLVRLNLSDNMIESVLNAYACVGAITFLDISKNRLESCAGLERLLALETLDIRENYLEEADELGRLSVVPTIKSIWGEGNPLEDDWRVRCFSIFLRDGHNIVLDGSGPSLLERRYLTTEAPPTILQTNPELEGPSSLILPPTVTVSPSLSPAVSPPPPETPDVTVSPPSPPPVSLAVPAKPRKRAKRIINLAEPPVTPTIVEEPSTMPEAVANPEVKAPVEQSPEPQASSPPATESSHLGRRKSSHSRRATDFGPSSPPATLQYYAQPGGSQRRRPKRSAGTLQDAFPELNEDPSADDFRAQMEALRHETGEDWLKVLAQRDLVTSTQSN
jgi:Leucine-rich repeat (LRR) protein